jgi:hypothetical protein
MKKVVLDANIYVSALLKPGGLQAGLLLRGLAGEFQIVISESIFREICRVVLYPKIAERLPISRKDLKKFLERIIDAAMFTMDEVKVEICEDPKDDIYLSCVKESQADFLVSGDAHLLNLKAFETAKILTSREFVETIFRG